MDISNAESAFAKGSTVFKEWESKFEERWYRPVIKTQLLIFLANLTVEQREQFAPQIKQIQDKLGIGDKEDGNLQRAGQYRSESQNIGEVPGPIEYEGAARPLPGPVD